MFTFPYAPLDVRATLEANAALWPTGTLYSDKHPTTWKSVPTIQYAWDGTSGQEQQREFCTIRITVWGWKVVTSTTSTTTTTTTYGEDDCADLASLVQAVLLDAGSSSVWRYTRGLGRSPGIDPDTGLPFCTFTVSAETRPQPVV